MVCPVSCSCDSTPTSSACACIYVCPHGFSICMVCSQCTRASHRNTWRLFPHPPRGSVSCRLVSGSAKRGPSSNPARAEDEDEAFASARRCVCDGVLMVHHQAQQTCSIFTRASRTRRVSAYIQAISNVACHHRILRGLSETRAPLPPIRTRFLTAPLRALHPQFPSASPPSFARRAAPRSRRCSSGPASCGPGSDGGSDGGSARGARGAETRRDGRASTARARLRADYARPACSVR